MSKEREEPIRLAKDAAAAAVLVAALAALGVGLVVFLPKLWRLL
ncbi:diacylglycerol kinase [Prosthecobacter sp.]